MRCSADPVDSKCTQIVKNSLPSITWCRHSRRRYGNTSLHNVRIEFARVMPGSHLRDKLRHAISSCYSKRHIYHAEFFPWPWCSRTRGSRTQTRIDNEGVAVKRENHDCLFGTSPILVSERSLLCAAHNRIYALRYFFPMRRHRILLCRARSAADFASFDTKERVGRWRS